MKEYRKVFFIGIGGIGMSALARHFLFTGAIVFGYDRERTELTRELEAEGVIIQYDTNTKSLPIDVDLVVYTPAVPIDNPIYMWFSYKSVPLIKRAQLLAQIAEQYKLIAVAGTHGKTTTTTGITHILSKTNKGLIAFVGGIMKNFNSNYVLTNNPSYCIVEADEFDRSFLQLFPDITIITSIEADHLNIYNNYESVESAFKQFAAQTKENGLLILHESVKDIVISNNINVIVYGKKADANVQIYKAVQTPKGYYVDIRYKDRLFKDIFIPVWGQHNLENIIVAMIVAIELGVSVEDFCKAVLSFTGVRRRFDIRVNLPNVVYIDDYAHHPKEIGACIAAVRECFSNRKITGIFQPHLYSRTKDFVGEFAEVLGKLDHIVLTDIYPAREEPIEGVNAEFLLQKIKHENKVVVSKENLVEYVKSLESIELLLTMGAGDIGALVPQFEQLFKN